MARVTLPSRTGGDCPPRALSPPKANRAIVSVLALFTCVFDADDSGRLSRNAAVGRLYAEPRGVEGTVPQTFKQTFKGCLKSLVMSACCVGKGRTPGFASLRLRKTLASTLPFGPKNHVRKPKKVSMDRNAKAQRIERRQRIRLTRQLPSD